MAALNYSETTGYATYYDTSTSTSTSSFIYPTSSSTPSFIYPTAIWPRLSTTNSSIIYDFEGNWQKTIGLWQQFKIPIKTKLKQIIKDRIAPNIIIKNNDRRIPLKVSKDIREQRARETLRKILGEKKFINFLKCGFLSIKAKSNKIYQIFPGSQFTCVFENGKLIEKLCVILTGNFPPSDSLLMRYLLILNNEEEFRSLANKHPVYSQNLELGEKNVKSLVDIFRELKVA